MSAAGIRIRTPDAAKLREVTARMERGRFLRRANAQIGKRVEKEFRRFFAAKPSNKRGWKTTNFWRRRIRNATLLTSFDETGSTITIADPAMNLAIHGGTVKPREKKFLTIPARAEAYGRSARTFGGELVFVPLTRGRLVGMLVRKNKTTGGAARKRGFSRASGAGKLDVYYWCVASATISPQKDALPTDIAINQWLVEEVGTIIARETKTGGAR